MRIAIAQINPTVGDLEFNRGLILEAMEHARSERCDLVIFPEMAVIGYPPKDLLERPSFVRANEEILDELVAASHGIHVVCGYVQSRPGPSGRELYNAVAMFGEGKILGKAYKRLLPFYDVFDETRYFEPGDLPEIIPFKGYRIGLTVCEDIWNDPELFSHTWYNLDPIRELAQQGVDIIVNVSASPYFMRKRLLRERLLRSMCKRYGVICAYVNQVGGNDDLLFDGASMIFDKQGEKKLQAREFEVDFAVWDTDAETGDMRDVCEEVEGSVLAGLTMGVRDYLAKCGFKKALIGLSGGIDSSLVAVIAAKALGPENVMGLSMPSQYTRDISKDDARSLSRNLGIEFHEIPIGDIFHSYLKALSELFKGLPENEAEENIQARVRGNLLMAVSNKLGHLLLSTGNKSEIAVGYCTLYGDMSGGLAVISDVPKTLVYDLARYINREKEIIPPRIIERPPSAELRPDQTDQDSLPPYDILDAILRAYVEDHKGLSAIMEMSEELGFDEETARMVIRRVNRNEYKRLQMPPGLKITAKAFGYGRRYPIAKGGFE